ncbi:hypothetical protein CANARDRAFT_9307 [[Candida] arabinofermentans NRRL YB-2248]|uniref:Amine oxidase domain-containing protein n=1 Tax=[Candida] arabinofermentans NRRL YB-2248 TaxID=983967 RepID=A0A1E4SW67_9ASCO|nr:hypothetical protein CANARDRAFT_9307 [[Candida] arabinofermentans NRRL YB-2248]
MSETSATVLIVGGGIAGLNAALNLHRYGVDFVLLEARDRLGGRILTNKSGLKPYDLGASWAHDTLSNPLFDEMVESEKYDLYYDDHKIYYFGEVLSPEDFDEMKIEQVTNEMTKYIELQHFENLDQKDCTLHEIVYDYLYKQRKLLSEKQIDYAPQFMRNLELWHGISWDEISSKFCMVDNVGRNCLIRGGYSDVIDEMVKQLPREKLKLNQVIKSIDRTKDVNIETIDGHIYRSKYAIITVPQSILQLNPTETGGITWTPKLPSQITNALEHMSFGKLGKIIFEFSEAFWSHLNTDRFVAVPTPKGMAKVHSCLAQNIKPTVQSSSNGLPEPWDFPLLILNMHKINKVPSLLCFTQGELTEYLEENPDKAWDFMKPMISKLSMCDAHVPDPVNVISTKWSQDPFSRGSYAACKPGDDPTDLVIALERGLSNVRFAGEHTILDGAGAVHGAWLSGAREADVILVELGIKEGDSSEW